MRFSRELVVRTSLMETGSLPLPGAGAAAVVMVLPLAAIVQGEGLAACVVRRSEVADQWKRRWVVERVSS